MDDRTSGRCMLLFIFWVCFFLFQTNCFCKKKELEVVNKNKKTILGNIQNKIKKYEEHNLLVVTNIHHLEQAYTEFLSLLNYGKNQIKKIVYLEKEDGRENQVIERKGAEGEGEAQYGRGGKQKKENHSFNKIDVHFFNGVFIILNILDDVTVKKLDIAFLQQFIEKEKSLFLSVNCVIGKKAFLFLSKLNISVYGNESYVYDIFGASFLKLHRSSRNFNNLFYTDEIIKDTPVTDLSERNAKLLYRGTAHSILLKEKYYLEIVTCTNTCLLYENQNNNSNTNRKRNLGLGHDQGQGQGFGHNQNRKVIYKKMGKELLLVSAIQYENNCRFIFSSSSDIFSDAFFRLNTENKKFTSDIIQWNLNRKGIIRYNNFKIYKSASLETVPFFINEEVRMTVDFYELQSNFWIPYKTNDMQFEVYKIKIQLRDFLDTYKNKNDPTYFKNWKLPPKHGIYKIRIYYLKRGYNILHLEYFLTVRNYLHFDKMKKVKMRDYPFYCYMYISLLVVLLFILIFIFDDSDSENEKIKKDD